MSGTLQAPAAPEERQSGIWGTPFLQEFKRRAFTQERAMTVVALLLILLFWQTAPSFLTKSNFIDIGSTSAYFAIVAVGMTFLFIAGEFDLSLGATYGFAGTLIAYFNTSGSSALVALLLGLGIAIAIGLINGLVTTLGRVPSFIVTVGMLSILEGLAQYLSGGQPITLDTAAQNSVFAKIATAQPLGLPAPLLLGAAVMIGSAFLLRATRLGAHIYLTGGNPRAAAKVGISTVRVKTFCFVFAAFLAGLAGAMQIFDLQSAQPGTGSGDFLFEAVGAAIIGGVALTGGEGSIYGTFIGAVILAVLTNGLALSGVDPGIGIFLTGLLIVIAGVLNSSMREGIAVLVRRARVRRHEQAGAASPRQ
jgi:ribose transport system permease protein